MLLLEISMAQLNESVRVKYRGQDAGADNKSFINCMVLALVLVLGFFCWILMLHISSYKFRQ